MAFGGLKPSRDGRWSFRGLVIMALLWVWSEEATLTGRFSSVLQIAGRLWSQPPLVLRLVIVQGSRQPWYLVTSVCDARLLTDQDIVEIYQRRWGIELFYRHLKQTFTRRKLRSHTADHVLCEAHWSLLGLWAMLLYTEHHLHRRVAPRRISVAKVLQAFRSLLKQPVLTSSSPLRFAAALNASVIDPYVRRNKNSRNYPRKKSEPPCGPPTLQKASRHQQQIAKQLKRMLQG